MAEILEMIREYANIALAQPGVSHVANLPALTNHMELTRWLHVFFGIIWIGMLYYFNFVQTEYFKVAEAAAKADVLRKLAPRALWWFRWGAAFTFLTGVLMLHLTGWLRMDIYIFFGALLGTLMAFNVWFVIWPKQKVVIAAAPGAAAALVRAGTASRTNTMFSVPMLLFMMSSVHLGGAGAKPLIDSAKPLMDSITSMTAVWAGVALIVLLELNALFGTPKRVGITSVTGVIFMGFVLSIALASIIQYL